ncbi:hypothetical protein [Actinomadura rugatobispora]|uniref:Uncharacterized protein n=1 Tax=Actinomadura rugatobispora TaxID=1994 RepID=A0ABW1A4M7_9ACTN
MDDIAHLNKLHEEFVARGWPAEARTARSRTVLHVTNPDDPALNDTFVVKNGVVRFAWGQGVGPVTELSAVADRIQDVLRGVGR